MTLIVQPGGNVDAIYAEVIDLLCPGHLSIRRASHVEPDAEGRWWADLTPVGGSKLGPFDVRSQALDAELRWLEGFPVSTSPRPKNSISGKTLTPICFDAGNLFKKRHAFTQAQPPRESQSFGQLRRHMFKGFATHSRPATALLRISGLQCVAGDMQRT